MSKNRTRLIRATLALSCIVEAGRATAWAYNGPQAPEGVWESGFHVAGANGTVYAAVIYDDGKGPGVVIGGDFTQVGAVTANRLACWRNGQWEEFGGGANAIVRSLLVADLADGSGPGLFAGGGFSTIGGVTANKIARWDGASWEPLGIGVENGGVYCLCKHQDANGCWLFAGGEFISAGGIFTRGIARWNGMQWQQAGDPLEPFGRVFAMTNHDDGTGESLYIGGSFSSSNRVSLGNIARWDGAQWVPVTLHGMSGSVYALASLDIGRGPELFAGGNLDYSGPIDLENVARLVDGQWASVGRGLDGAVVSLAASNVGGRLQLYAGGSFLGRIAVWNGVAWNVLGNGVDGFVHAMLTTSLIDGQPRLLAAGDFKYLGMLGGSLNRLGMWDGLGWRRIGDGLGFDGSVVSSCIHPHQGIPSLFAAGSFTDAGGVNARYIARWGGSQWEALPGLLNGSVSHIQSHDADGPGPLPAELFVSGSFGQVGGQSIGYGLARWDGSQWHGMQNGVELGEVRSFHVHDEDGPGGSEPLLFAGGTFYVIGGLNVELALARWSGSSWSLVGSGIAGDVYAMTSFDLDDEGPANPQLIVAGILTMSGPPYPHRVAAWNGSSWTFLGPPFTGRIESLAVFDQDGVGPIPSRLFAGGVFQSVEGIPTNSLAQWDGEHWLPVPGGVTISGGTGLAAKMTVVNMCGHESLLVAGGFDFADGKPVNNIARWNGVEWDGLSGGVTDSTISTAVIDVLEFDDGTGSSVWAFGTFTKAGTYPSSRVARWRCDAASTCAADVDKSGIVNVDDLLAVINSWGPCLPEPNGCPADIVPTAVGGDGIVNVDDLLAVINAWGPCPE